MEFFEKLGFAVLGNSPFQQDKQHEDDCADAAETAEEAKCCCADAVDEAADAVKDAVEKAVDAVADTAEEIKDCCCRKDD